mmetsp:Transcript_608/g.1490  ORF Transcript_608/g.1490 Transcript_608/m.1490 type:complete len:543 (+) Transcript_608:110-1738(+)
MGDPGEYSGGSDNEDDDIARFERQCAARARAEGLPAGDEDDDAGDQSDGQDDLQIRRVRLVNGAGSPKNEGDWREKCQGLLEKLARREQELSQVRSDLELVKSDGLGAGDVSTELKQRLMELTKKNRRMQVTLESQKSKIQQLESDVKKTHNVDKKQAEELKMQDNDALYAVGAEDWKNKYLVASNQLQQVRHDMQETRVQVQRQKKVLLKELGTEEAMEKAMSVADDPNDISWKGRAAQISQLQRQVRELRERGPEAASTAEGGETPQRPQRGGRHDQAGEKERAVLDKAAEKRREEFDRLQEEVERLRGAEAEFKRKREALKSRSGLLEGQLRELKAHVQTLVGKSQNDDALVEALRRQLGRRGEDSREGAMSPSGGSSAEAERLKRDNADLNAQLERQALIVQQLRQKTLEQAVENGSTRLGPKSAESGTSERQLIDRVRFLEAENARQTEQVRLMKDRYGDEGVGRPFSAESSIVKDKLRRTSERLRDAERENGALRRNVPVDGLARPDSSASCRSSRSSSRGGGRVVPCGDDYYDQG